MRARNSKEFGNFRISGTWSRYQVNLRTGDRGVIPTIQHNGVTYQLLLKNGDFILFGKSHYESMFVRNEKTHATHFFEFQSSAYDYCVSYFFYGADRIAFHIGGFHPSFRVFNISGESAVLVFHVSINSYTPIRHFFGTAYVLLTKQDEKVLRHYTYSFLTNAIVPIDMEYSLIDHGVVMQDFLLVVSMKEMCAFYLPTGKLVKTWACPGYRIITWSLALDGKHLAAYKYSKKVNTMSYYEFM